MGNQRRMPLDELVEALSSTLVDRIAQYVNPNTEPITAHLKAPGKKRPHGLREAMAKEFGVSTRTIDRYYADKNRIPLSSAERIADRTGRHPAQIWAGYYETQEAS